MRFVLSTLLVLYSSLATAQVAPRLSVGTTEVTVSNIEAGGSVVVFAVGLRPLDHGNAVFTFENVVVDEDRDGIIGLAVPEIPRRSVWIAVDVKSGLHTIAGARDFPLHVAELSPENSPAAAALVGKGADLHFLLVRPRVGAWSGVVASGGPLDRDVREEQAAIDVGDLKPVGGDGQALSAVAPEDLVLVIDSNDLTHAIGTVTR